ncbi:MAG: hypothetical protein KTR30_34280 [Saprospiraceae bacterium]|nr:hypothetical protein [Saprospiraceae bacterium]
MEDFDPKEFLLFALHHFGLEVQDQVGKMVYLKQAYAVEVEGKNLFKLLQEGQVVAPFSDVEELCTFIKMDMQLNEES